MANVTAQQPPHLKIAVVLNGVSLHKKRFYKIFLPKLSKHFSIDVFETRSKDDAVMLAKNAAEVKYKIILAAGGDGTLNQVINGILNANQKHAPAVGIIL